MVASTLFAASAAGNIELRMSNYAMPHCKLENAQEKSPLTEQVERALKGPKPLQSITGVKRKADDTHDIPRFCRGYLSDSSSSLSPSAARTEIAPLLPSPSPHLLSDRTFPSL